MTDKLRELIEKWKFDSESAEYMAGQCEATEGSRAAVTCVLRALALTFRECITDLETLLSEAEDGR